MTTFIARWGIIGTGWIASKFVEDIGLQRDEITDVAHAVVAVGSKDAARAEKFIEAYCSTGASAQHRGLFQHRPKPGTYDDVLENPDVDIVYIGTLHASHYNDCKAAIKAGKHVLVEKPAVLNAAEWESLASLAESKQVFLMEAMWSRFLPLAQSLEKALHQDKIIGDVKIVKADYANFFYDAWPDSHRVFDRQAAGGAWMDIGIYVLFPALLALYHDPRNEGSPPENLSVNMLFGRPGVDITTTVTFNFPKLMAQAVLCTSRACGAQRDERVQIIGTKGEIVIRDGPNRMTKMTIKRVDGEQDPVASERTWLPDEDITQDFAGMGLQWEADSVARCIQNGSLQNPLWPISETLLVLKINDSVRKKGGYVYPPGLETVEGKE